MSQLYQRLLQIYESGKKAVVLIDEAQMLETREIMEEFRGLLNLEVPERKLISFVFFGLPEIEKNLKLDPPLAQRVALRYRLEPFTADSTEAYVKHRLRLAGCPKMPFTPEAIEAIHRHSGGRRASSTRCATTRCSRPSWRAPRRSRGRWSIRSATTWVWARKRKRKRRRPSQRPPRPLPWRPWPRRGRRPDLIWPK